MISILHNPANLTDGNRAPGKLSDNDGSGKWCEEQIERRSVQGRFSLKSQCTVAAQLFIKPERFFG